MQMATGFYIGDGIDNTFISVGFQPEMVMIKGDVQQKSVFKIAALSGDATLPLGGSDPPFPDAIKSLDVKGGFMIGTNETVNSNGFVYHWIAFKDNDANIFTQGTYTGNGIAGTLISTGFQPDLVWIKTKRTTNSNAVYRDSLETGDQTHEPTATNGYQTNRITSFDTNGFRIGNHAQVNNLGDSYYYFAFRQSNQFKSGTVWPAPI